jgi:hypothetical protein
MVTIACLCPPLTSGDTRHPAGDEVHLRERLDFRAAATMRNVIAFMQAEDEGASVPEILAALTEHYLLLGVESWTLVDARNKPIEVSKATIREHLLSHPDVAMEVGDAADELYSEAVIAPLVAKAQRSSPPSRTNGSTSATRRSPAPPRKRSRPSSTTTTPTDDTATTSLSLVGASSSSQNSR